MMTTMMMMMMMRRTNTQKEGRRVWGIFEEGKCLTCFFFVFFLSCVENFCVVAAPRRKYNAADPPSQSFTRRRVFERAKLFVGEKFYETKNGF